ncbi:MAG: PAS domain S-box protein, partial [Sphingopyxis sp.]|nr:PAS domain S-box protein [Sphingopyxis sp.]
IGFNGGSTLHASADVAPIILNTVLAGGIGTCVGYVLGHIQDGVVLPEKSLSGMLGGLVAVTAGCHILEPGGAMLVGAIGVHAFAGVAGTLLLALLAPVDRLPAGSRFDQLYIQVFGAALNFYWSFGLGYLFFAALDRVMHIRVTADVEEIGLNVSEHGSRLGVGHVEQALTDLVGGTADLRHRLPVHAGDEAEKLTALFNRLMDNIEAEERAREELRALKRDHEEAERVTALANATFEAIVIHDSGTIVDGNKQLAELLGLPMEEVIGRSIFDFVTEEEIGRVDELADGAAEFNREITLTRGDGERIPIEARGRSIVYRGKTMRIGCLVDLRERKLAESHIRYLALH